MLPLTKTHEKVTAVSTGAVPVALSMIFALLDRLGYELDLWVLWLGVVLAVLTLLICLATSLHLGVMWWRSRVRKAKGSQTTYGATPLANRKVPDKYIVGGRAEDEPANIGPMPTQEALRAVTFEKASPTLPLSITALQVSSFSAQAGLATTIQDGTTRDPPMLTLRETFISNTSLTHAMTLRLYLRLRSSDGADFRIEATGRDAWGHRLGRDDLATSMGEKLKVDPLKYLLSPVNLPPNTTAHGAIPFLFTMVDKNDSEDGGLYLDILRRMTGMGGNSYGLSLEVEDVVSKTTLSVPIGTYIRARPSDGGFPTAQGGDL